MEGIVLKKESVEESTKLFWSPSVAWRPESGKLKIEMFIYDEFALSLFPSLYYLTQSGIVFSALVEKFAPDKKRKVAAFLRDLLKKRILVTGLLTPQEVFYPQTKLFSTEYGDELLFNAKALGDFKTIQLNRRIPAEEVPEKRVVLRSDFKFPANFEDRKSHRVFSQESMPFETFQKFVSIFRQRIDDSGLRYYYATAGGLYPIDIYLHIKEGRIENLGPGVYFYQPVDHSLVLVEPDADLNNEAHLFLNKEIFNSSAFSLYFFYNADVTMPKYRSDGYLYALLDTGILIGTLTLAGELLNMGFCSIGEIVFTKVEKFFHLNDRQIYLHTVECGLKL
jgi:SagB-type dehydrogenase family enzyme